MTEISDGLYVEFSVINSYFLYTLYIYIYIYQNNMARFYENNKLDLDDQASRSLADVANN